jgi:hypothetical protein
MIPTIPTGKASGMVFVMMLLMSGTIGMNAAYTADSLEGATIDVGEHVAELDRHTDPVTRSERVGTRGQEYLYKLEAMIPVSELQTPVDPYIEAAVMGLTKNMMQFLLTFANAVSVFTYKHLLWIPAAVFQTLLSGITIGFFGWMLVWQVRTVKEAAES